MKRLLLRLLGHDEVMNELSNQYDELICFVWTNCNMVDSQKKSDKGYFSDEVSQKWNKFHELTTKFHKTLNKG